MTKAPTAKAIGASIAAVLALGGRCGADDAAAGIAVGGTMKLSGGSTLTFERVVADGRCPLPPIQCAASGFATIEVSIGPKSPRRLTLSIPGAVRAVTEGVVLMPTGETNFFVEGQKSYTLVALEPVPVSIEGEAARLARGGYHAIFLERGPPIGAARLDGDGTVVLDLRAEAPDGTVGHGQLRYPKSHAEYQSVLRHLGGLFVGQTKPVLPFPETRVPGP